MGSPVLVYGNALYGNSSISYSLAKSVSGFDGTALGDKNPDNFGRITNESFPEQFRIDLGAAENIYGIIVINTNLGAGNSAAFEASADNFSNTPQSEPIILVNDGNGYYITGSAWNYRYHQIQTNIGGEDIDKFIGQIYLMQNNPYTFVQDMNEDYERLPPNSYINHTVSTGQVYQKRLSHMPAVRFKLKDIKDAQKTIIEAANKERYVMFAIDGITGGDYSSIPFGRFYQVSQFVHEKTSISTNYWNVSCVFETMQFTSIYTELT